MDRNSKVSEVDKKIKSLERELFELSQLVNKLTPKVDKIKVEDTKTSNEIVQDDIQKVKGIIDQDFFKKL